MGQKWLFKLVSDTKLKQLIEIAIKQVLNEVLDADDESFRVTDKGEHHVSQGTDDRFWGNRGAGILLIAKDTGRLLLVLRSKYVNEPGTWGIPGGKIDDEESPNSAALREAQEELGYSGTIDTIPAHVFKAGNFRFYNFLGVIPTEFKPTLNWENSDANWFSLSDLPSPLHFGVQSLLTNSADKVKEIVGTHQD